MNHTSFLLFPGTRCDTIPLCALYPLLDHLSFYQPGATFASEQMEGCPEQLSTWCTPVVPFPLPEEVQEKLFALLAEIQSRTDDFARQLGTAMIHKRRDDQSGIEQSAQVLASVLSEKTDISDSGDEEALNRVWNAWLTVELATLHEKQEREIARKMNLLLDQEKTLHTLLHGEEKQQEGTGGLPEPLVAASPARLSGWTRLYLADRRPAAMLVTGDNEAVETLLDAAAQGVQDVVFPAMNLPLPDTAHHAFDDLETLRHNALDIRRLFCQCLANHGDNKEEMEKKWHLLLQQQEITPAPNCSLKVYIFTDIDPQSLFHKAFLPPSPLRPGAGAVIIHMDSSQPAAPYLLD